MRLLNVNTYELQEFVGGNTPPYAILSHTWESDEVLFHDIANLNGARNKKGFWKIERCCAQALDDGWGWIWADTCCIDKTSSAELSEAINSMFHWYKHAMVCYAYLSDIDSRQTLVARLGEMEKYLGSSPPAVQMPCRWFYRSWTLQELIAPKLVRFFGKDWTHLGSKSDLGPQLSKATGINAKILERPFGLGLVPAGEKMRWAAHRQATRVEDMSYSLLGIFDVNMPLLYGEGKKAFSRLQEHILKATEDHTLLFFNMSPLQPGNTDTVPTDRTSLIAQSPRDFVSESNVVKFMTSQLSQPGYVIDAGAGEPGLRIHLPLKKLSRWELEAFQLERSQSNHWYLATFNLFANPELRNQNPYFYSIKERSFVQTDGFSGDLHIAFLLYLDSASKTNHHRLTECWAFSKYVLVPGADVDKWGLEPLFIAPLPQDWDTMEPLELFTVESSQAMSPLATERGYQIIDSETSERTRTLGHSERYWILTGPGEPIVAYFKYIRYDDEFVYFIERTSPASSPRDVLYKWRWWQDDKAFRKCPQGDGLVSEHRFVVDDRLSAVFLIVRRFDDSSYGGIKVYFQVQTTPPGQDLIMSDISQ